MIHNNILFSYILTILPKANKQRQFLKNWRPISLLNVSYKILSSCIANRIKLVLPYLIHEDQKGFLSGRYIGENTRITYDVLHAAKTNNIPGMLLIVDFEKAFDSISWNYMYKVLNFFKFGHDIKKWIQIINTDVNLCVIQSGFFSKFFKIERGCRQGDPASPYIFNLCVEILAILIRHNENIKGITIENKEYCLLQYADDTVIFLDGSEKSLKSALDLLFQFAKYSGLKPNIDKTKAIWIGSKIDCDDTLCAEYDLCWSKGTFSILGIHFNAKLENMEQLNYNDKILGIEKELII